MSYADTLLRYSHQVQHRSDFASDMRSIALEEASHFEMLAERLEELGHGYGTLPVIARLSNAIQETQ